VLEQRLHFQLIFSKKGSPSHFDIDQNGKGILTQFNPAPAISAKSFSVYAHPGHSGVNAQ